MTLRERWRAWRDRPRQCSSFSNPFVGYRCEFDRGHEGRHEAVIGRTRTMVAGDWVETGKSTAHWE